MREISNLRTMSRRRFLESLASIGISSQVLNHITQDKLEKITSDPNKEVPRLKEVRTVQTPRGERREPVFYTIPRDKWIHVESTYDAARRVREKIDNETEHDRTDITVAVTTEADTDRDYSVEVQLIRNQSNDYEVATAEEELEQIRDVVSDEVSGKANTQKAESAAPMNVNITEPDVVSDIPVTYRTSVRSNDGGWCDSGDCEGNTSGDRYYEHAYRDHGRWWRPTEVMTGCTVGVEMPDDSDYEMGSCTLGPPVADSSSAERLFLTNAHCAYDRDNEVPEDAIGRTVYQPDTDNPIGEIKAADRHENITGAGWLDGALVSLESDYTNSGKLASKTRGQSDGELAPVEIEIDYLKDNQGTINISRQGRRTGRCTGRLYSIEPRNVEADQFPDEHGIQIQRNYSNGNGNSGGPYFYEEDGELKIVGMHQKSDVSERPPGHPCGDQDLAAGTHISSYKKYFDIYAAT